jgi:hypothetical protein
MNETKYGRQRMSQADPFCLALDCRRIVAHSAVVVPVNWTFMQRIDWIAARVGAAALASGRVRVLTVRGRPQGTAVNLALVAADRHGRVAVWTRGTSAHVSHNASERAAVCLPSADVLFARRARRADKERARRNVALRISMAADRGHLWARVRPIANTLAWQLYTGHFRTGLRVGALALADLLEEYDHYRAAAVRVLALAGKNPIPALAAYEPPLPSRRRHEPRHSPCHYCQTGIGSRCSCI